MKMSPLMSSVGNDKIASSEWGMLLQVRALRALPQRVDVRVRRFGAATRLESIVSDPFGWAALVQRRPLPRLRRPTSRPSLACDQPSLERPWHPCASQARTEHPGVNSDCVVDVDPPYDGRGLLWDVWIWHFCDNVEQAKVSLSLLLQAMPAVVFGFNQPYHDVPDRPMVG